MRTGTVKFFNHKNKFGFIIDNESKKEFYCHVRNVQGQINEGDSVSFELKEEKKGPVCVEVKKLE